MSKARNARKRKFKAALAWAGLTQKQWAAQQDYSSSYISHILSGFLENEAMTARIDEFTAKQIKAICTNGVAA